MRTAERNGFMKQCIATLVLVCLAFAGLVDRASGQPATPPPDQAEPEAPLAASDVTPVRVSYIDGEVSFWRPGAEDWGPAQANTPLAPGDMLYTGPRGNVELQLGPRAFVRATDGAQIALDNHEPQFVQLRVTTGTVAVDVRSLPDGDIIEIDTPGAAVTIARPGLYRVGVSEDVSRVVVYQGSAAVTQASGQTTTVQANQEAVVSGTDPDALRLGAAPPMTAWDRWNTERTDFLLHQAPARYVSPDMYGAEMLATYGTWRTVATYGAVWTPSGMPAGWVPYSTGRWLWDPRFGWTWLDDAPWGWAPYHHGRWVFIHNAWAWAPGPVVVRPVYAPALVVFLGGLNISAGRPLCWAPLGWGEPVIPWWGRRGFVGVPSWVGWRGPRVVNNVVIDRSVHVTNITVYRNVHVTNAVVGVPVDQFGRGRVPVTRINQPDVHRLRLVRGMPDARPVPASLLPAGGPAAKPSPPRTDRGVVATRAPRDPRPALQAHGLATGPTAVPPTPQRLVPPPRGEVSRGGDRAHQSPALPTAGDRIVEPAIPRPGGSPGAAIPHRGPDAPQSTPGGHERPAPGPAPAARPLPPASDPRMTGTPAPRRPASPPRDTAPATVPNAGEIRRGPGDAAGRPPTPPRGATSAPGAGEIRRGPDGVPPAPGPSAPAPRAVPPAPAAPTGEFRRGPDAGAPAPGRPAPAPQRMGPAPVSNGGDVRRNPEAAAPAPSRSAPPPRAMSPAPAPSGAEIRRAPDVPVAAPKRSVPTPPGNAPGPAPNGGEIRRAPEPGIPAQGRPTAPPSRPSSRGQTEDQGGGRGPDQGPQRGQDQGPAGISRGDRSSNR